MATFETHQCAECESAFAVESDAVPEEQDELTCPLCEAPVELNPLDEDEEEEE